MTSAWRRAVEAPVEGGVGDGVRVLADMCQETPVGDLKQAVGYLLKQTATALANVMLTFELARRLRDTGVTANALHPGVVHASFGAEDPCG